MPFLIRPLRRLPLAYWSGFLSLIILLLLSSGPVNAEWVEVGGYDRLTSYTDTATIRRKGNVVRMWDLIDFKTVQTSAGKPYLSVKAVREYDCR
jgi:hypothetical protein